MIGSIGIASVIWVAGTMVVHHTMTLGSLTSFVISLLLLYSPIKNIGRINGIVQPALAAASRVFEVLDRDPELKDCENPIELQPGPHRIKFDQVFFQYPGNENMVLRDINLDVEPGKLIALVGLSGSGKSTMANLVPRFFDVTAGTIYIDGINVKEVKLDSLRNEIAVVTQDNFLVQYNRSRKHSPGQSQSKPRSCREGGQRGFLPRLYHGAAGKIQHYDR